MVAAADLCDEVVAFLCQDNDDLVVCALSALRAAHKTKRETHTHRESQTRRSGRPYTLVLRKTDALFAREREARRRDQAEQSWLGRTFVAR